MIYPSGPCCVRLACDECDMEPMNTSFMTFAEARQWARDHNWKTQRDAQGEWQNICPACARAFGLLPPDPEPMDPSSYNMTDSEAKAVWVKATNT